MRSALGVGVGVVRRSTGRRVGVALVLGGVGGTVAWPNSSTPVGATTVVSIPADVSWAATFSATLTSAGRSAAAPMISCTGSPASRHWPSSSRVQPAEVSSDGRVRAGWWARCSRSRPARGRARRRRPPARRGRRRRARRRGRRGPRAPGGRGCRRAGRRRCGSASSVTTGWGAVWIRGGGCEPAERGAEGLVGVGQRDVDVTDAEPVHQRGTAEAAQHELVEHRRGVPVLVVAGEQDLAAGPVHGDDAERAAGRGQAVGQRAGPRAGRVLEQVRRAAGSRTASSRPGRAGRTRRRRPCLRRASGRR